MTSLGFTRTILIRLRRMLMLVAAGSRVRRIFRAEGGNRAPLAMLILAGSISLIFLKALGPVVEGNRQAGVVAADSKISSPAYFPVAAAARRWMTGRSREAIWSIRSTYRSGRRSAAG